MNLEVDRRDLRRTRLVANSKDDLRDGQARLRVDTFALTSNNVTYGAFGDALQYWNFFPASDEWGRIPAWGFAAVVESRHGEVPVGRRVYGYVPMGDELVVEPGKVDASGFSDVVAHRQPMSAVYSRYLRVDADPLYDAAREGQISVLRPLFSTSFLLDDYYADHATFDASCAVISSASSKTAIGTAFLVHDRPGVRVVGLTSAANRAFVESLGCYDNVVSYADVSTLGEDPAVFVDIAGNRDVVAAVHRHYGDRLRHSMVVGGTHWDHAPDTGLDALPGPRRVLLRADAGCQARRGLGAGRVRPPGRRRVAPIRRVDRPLARPTRGEGLGRDRPHLSRIARRARRPTRRLRVLDVDVNAQLAPPPARPCFQ